MRLLSGCVVLGLVLCAFLSPAARAEDEAKKPAPDLDAVLEHFKQCVREDQWSAMTAKVPPGAFQSQAQRLPESERATYVKGMQEARSLVATIPGEDLQLIVLVANFDTQEDARRFARHERLTVEGAKENPPVLRFDTKVLEDGAGTEGKEHGFVLHRIVHAMGQSMELHQQVFSIGTVTCELLAIGVPGMDRGKMDPVVDYVAAKLRDPAALVEPPPPLVVKPTRRTITIRVLDTEGNPVPRAQLTWILGNPQGRQTFKYLTCIDGVCRPAVGPEPARVVAYQATDAKEQPLNLGPSKSVPVTSDMTEVELRMPPGRRITGRVLDANGKPAQVARVEATATRRSGAEFAYWGKHASTLTGVKGEFELVGLADATYRIVVRRDHGMDATGQTFEGHRAGARDVELRLEKEHAVEITVVDPEGNPVEGVRVSAQPHGLSGTVPSAMTDAEGIARIRGLSATRFYNLSVEPPYRVRSTEFARYEQRRWRPQNTRVQLETGWILSGVVVDANGKPVEAIVIRKQAHGWRSSYTDAQGGFSMRGLPPGPVSVVALRRGSERDHQLVRKAPWVEVEPTSEPVELPIGELDASGMIRVRVLGPDGEPVPVVRVHLEWFTEAGDQAGGTARDITDGYGEFDPREGTFSLDVYFPRMAGGGVLPYAPAYRKGLRFGEDDVEIQLEKGRVLTGVVLGVDGEPVKTAVRLQAMPVQEDAMRGPGTANAWYAHQVLTTDMDGTFRFVALGRRAYHLHAMPDAPFAVPEPVRVAPEATHVEVRLSEGIALTVVDDDQRPLAGARVRVVRVRRPEKHAETYEYVFDEETDETGQVRIRRFGAADELRLTIDPPTGRASLRTHSDRRWRSEPATIVLERGFRIRGLVRDENGPVAGAAVVAELDSKEHHEYMGAAIALTDQEGRFESRSLPFKPTRVRAMRARSNLDDDPNRSEIVEVDPDNPEVTLTLEPRDASIRIRLAGAAKGMRVGLEREGGGTRWMAFESDDATTLVNLLKGTYAIFVRDPDDPSRLAYRTGVATSDAVVTLEWTTGRTVRFKVEVPDGVTDVRGMVRGPAGEWIEARRGADGTFEAIGVPEGTFRIEASGRLGDDWYVGAGETQDEGVPVIKLGKFEDSIPR